MTVWTLVGLPFAPLVFYGLGLALGETEPPRWWRRRRSVRRSAARIATTLEGSPAHAHR